ncbi:MAG: hypothetical protein ACFFBP_06820 [Promethearchaeota archaeon]
MSTNINILYCPRCKNTEGLIEYDESFDCPKCRLEFSKKDLVELEDQDILSIEEKKNLFQKISFEK